MNLKLYSDRTFLSGDEHIVMLYPFWGKNPESVNDPSGGRFDRYATEGNKFFQMVPLQEADFVVVPSAWEHIVENPTSLERTKQLIEVAAENNKTVIAFFCSDSTEPIPFDNLVVFRTSFYRSKRKTFEFALPAWSEDLVARFCDGRLPVRQKQAQPIVGFCGYAAISSGRKLKSTLRRIANRFNPFELGNGSPESGLMIREQAIKALRNSAQVKTNFFIRNQFFGNLGNLYQARQEYVQNMVESDYVLCVRGAGNFSYRLYETLSLGRIPVFVDTDCVLPYDFLIDWKKHFVWVDQSDLPLIGEKVAAIHEQLSPQDFIDLQRQCRQMWEQWIAPEGFFANFYRHFHWEVA